MGLTASRWLILVAAIVVVFGVTVAVALQVVPGPHSETDYLVIGSVATLLALVVVFVVLMVTSPKAGGLFFKRRPRD